MGTPGWGNSQAVFLLLGGRLAYMGDLLQAISLLLEGSQAQGGL